MPNYCNFEMRVKGTYENLKTFVSYLKAGYDFDENSRSYPVGAKKHFFRIFEANATFDNEPEDNNEYCSCDIDGYCAWSVSSCMFDGGHSYYSRNGGEDATTLELASAELNLTIEVCSIEEGINFMEHYIVAKGITLVEECEEYEPIYADDDECEMIGYRGGLPTGFTI